MRSSRILIVDGDLTDWLLDSDPALKWQVERDLVGAPEDVWRATRNAIATEGFGARLLDLQDDDGQWAGGAYFPGDVDFHNPNPEDQGGQPYIATTWSLNALREWGLEASALEGTAEKIDKNSTWEYEDLPYWGGEVDCCINGFTLANGAWLGADVAGILDWFAEHQMDDGGWNCEWENGSVRSSFDSTLNSLFGILAYEQFTGHSTKALRAPAEEYLLERELAKRKSTGEVVDPRIYRFAYPFRWFYTTLRAADYFREASAVDGVEPDPRIAEAIESVIDQRQDNGTWLQARRHPGRVWFEVDVEAGEPSKWLTLYATRVLEWWETSGSTAG